MPKPIIVSGIQPTGNLHIGNYLGAVRNWVQLQNGGDYEMYIMIVDLHSLSGGIKGKELHDQIIRTAVELLSAGIDPDKTTFFVQSHVPHCTELAWIFNTITPLAELERMTQFKDKSLRQAKNVNAGLLTYPILQAADILLYKGALVPVGQDQIQHVELTRDIAKLFNKKFEPYFPEAKHLLTHFPKVMSLLEPTKKMSKSHGADSIIELADEPAVIEKKLKKAVTATEGGEGAPGVENLLSLLKEFGNADTHKQFVIAEKDGTIRYGDLKKEVASALSVYFTDFRERRSALLEDRDEIASILIRGAKKAQAEAEKTMTDVRKIVGIRL